MAEILVNKLINEQIDVDLIIKWLVKINPEGQYLDGFEDLKCSRTDLLTYILNFLHEELPCLKKLGESLQKAGTTSKQIDFSETPCQKRINVLPSPVTSSSTQSSDSDEVPKTGPNCPSPQKASTSKSLNIDTFNTLTPLKTDFNVSSAQKTDINKQREPPLVQTTPAKTGAATNFPDLSNSPIRRASACGSPKLSEKDPEITPKRFSTPKHETRNSTANKSSEKAGSLCLGDFFVNVKISAKKKSGRNIFAPDSSGESSRRIKPTCLSQVNCNSGFRKNGNSFNNFQDAKVVPAESLDKTRSLLAEARQKISVTKEFALDIPPVASFKKTYSYDLKEVEPKVDSVTKKRQLDIFAEIYVSILRNQLVLNITSEIYFLISLLLLKGYELEKTEIYIGSGDPSSDEDEPQLPDLFSSVHNTVYFAVKCLESQTDLLRCYDKTALRLLSRNERLRLFSHSFAAKLGQIAETKPNRVVEIPYDNVQTNVCFNWDTDTRGNFPNDPSFHAFRKQRDLFYGILRVWEAEHLVIGWKFSAALGEKIRSLFKLHSEPVVFVHFAKLFKDQLLSSRDQFHNEEGIGDFSFLSSISKINAEKLNKLNSRLVTKESSNGINSPLFTEVQEFYRDFIVTAANCTFNRHLCDTLITEIVELNDTSFSCTDLEGMDGRIDPSSQKSYVSCVKSLGVLAKFLGFVQSLPYKSDGSNLTEKVLNLQIDLRKQVTPMFDVKTLLEDSIKERNLVLVIPWLTRYLSMLDYVTLRLPYYLSICTVLFELHKNCDKALGNKTNASNYNATLVKFCLGWLFELPHFPDSEYLKVCVTTPEEGMFGKKTITKVRKRDKGPMLDTLDIVDHDVLYSFCPHLEEVKKLLYSNTLNKSLTVKHITPLTSLSTADERSKKLQQQLEEAFFNGQPDSVRKSVEFVSDQIFRACARHIHTTVIPLAKKSGLANLRVSLNSHNLAKEKDTDLSSSLSLDANHMAKCSVDSLKRKCDKVISDMIKDRVPTSIANLMMTDVLPQMTQVCIVIATRMCRERMNRWVQTNVTPALFYKEFHNEVQNVLHPDGRKTKKASASPWVCCSEEHNDDTLSGPHLLDRIRVMSVGALENPGELGKDRVVDVLEQAYRSLTERCDITEPVVRSTCVLLLDLSLFLITHNPGLMGDEGLLKKFIRVWNCYSDHFFFKRLLCARNVMLFSQSCNEAVVWESFASFVLVLVQKQVLTVDALEVMCLEFYRTEWDKGTLDNFHRFLNKFVRLYKSMGGRPVLLEFVSDFCADV